MGDSNMSERLRRRGNIWYGVVYVDGRRTECTTGCRDEASARAVLAEWERRAADPDRESENTTLDAALTTYLADCSARVRSGDIVEHTVASYRKQAGHLLDVFGRDYPVRSFKNATPVFDYIDKRRNERAVDNTIKKELRVLLSSLRAAKERGRWFGDLDAVVPQTFKPKYNEKVRDFRRDELAKLIPFLNPNAAAVVCFILMTGAEDAALRTALRSDLPADTDQPPLLRVRGTKNHLRDRKVPIISDEQRVLLAFVTKHAQGEDGLLFGGLSNLRRNLHDAAEAAGIPHVWPHALRKAAGQFLVDQHVPIELVARFLGHANTRITEKVYARVRQEDLHDRMLSAIAPEYATTALANQGRPSTVATIKELPEPKLMEKLYEVDGESRTLAQWGRVHAIPKATLHDRVITRGMSMRDALGVRHCRSKVRQSNKRHGGGRTSSRESEKLSDDCRKTAANNCGNGDLLGQNHSVTATRLSKKPRNKRGNAVPRDRIELPTRGFSIPCSTN